MLLQKIMLSCAMPHTENMLYQAPAGATLYNSKTGTLFLKEKQTVSFESYFNVFSSGKICRVTELEQAQLNLCLQGTFEITLWQRDGDGRKKLLIRKQHTVAIPETWTYAAAFSPKNTPENSYLFFTVQAMGGDVQILGGSWSAKKEICREVRMAVCICTYKREEYVRRNLQNISCALKEEKRGWPGVVDIIVADNAGTLNPQEWKSMPVTVIRNRNYGGSGGFTRCLLEAQYRGQYTHILMQDDDIVLEPECLYRTMVLLSMRCEAHEEMCIAGGMFSLEKPSCQYEASSLWRGTPTALKHNLQMDTWQGLTANNYPEKADYGAWWYFCMPTTFLRQNNLPLPLFIKCDDVEYGLRNARDIQVINGIGVWHEGFDKKFNLCLEYYSSRNALFVDALYPDNYSLRKGVVRETLLLLRWLLRQNDQAAEFRLRALRDFKKGIPFFESTDEEQLHQELTAENKDWLNRHTVPKDSFVRPPHVEAQENSGTNTIARKSALRMLGEYLLPRPFPHKELTVVEMNASLRDFVGHSDMIQYNAGDETVCRTHASKRTFWRYLLRYLWMAVPVWIGARIYQKRLKRQAAEVCSARFWQEHLGISPQEQTAGQER